MKRFLDIIEYILLCIFALGFWIAIIGLSDGCNNLIDFFN